MKAIKAVVTMSVLIGFALGPTVSSAHSPAGHSYQVSVFSNQGEQFNDCFSFDKKGTLIVAGYGPMIYRNDQLNTQVDAFQASTSRRPIPFGFILSLHGTVGGEAGQTISGNVLNEFGGTFIFQGIVVPTCPVETTKANGSPYLTN